MNETESTSSASALSFSSLSSEETTPPSNQRILREDVMLFCKNNNEDEALRLLQMIDFSSDPVISGFCINLLNLARQQNQQQIAAALICRMRIEHLTDEVLEILTLDGSPIMVEAIKALFQRWHSENILTIYWTLISIKEELVTKLYNSREITNLLKDLFSRYLNDQEVLLFLPFISPDNISQFLAPHLSTDVTILEETLSFLKISEKTQMIPCIPIKESTPFLRRHLELLPFATSKQKSAMLESACRSCTKVLQVAKRTFPQFHSIANSLASSTFVDHPSKDAITTYQYLEVDFERECRGLSIQLVKKQQKLQKLINHIKDCEDYSQKADYLEKMASLQVQLGQAIAQYQQINRTIDSLSRGTFDSYHVEIPEELRCAITDELMEDPVYIASDLGEKQDLRELPRLNRRILQRCMIQSKKGVSPFTRLLVKPRSVKSDPRLKVLAQKFLEEHPEFQSRRSSIRNFLRGTRSKPRSSNH